MIVKICPIKASSTGAIARVLEYIASDKGRIDDYTKQAVFHNLGATELEDIQREFQHNYDTYARKRKDGNIGHHVIISASPLDRDKLSIEIMDSVVRAYITKAYPEALAFATHHIHEEHVHSHIVVSANNFLSPKATRQSKTQLRENHTHLLEHIEKNFPELHIGVDTKKWGRRENSERTYYAHKRSDGILDKDKLRSRIQDIFRSSENTQQFYEKLKSEGYATYKHRGEPFGVYYGQENRKMRFSRLGLSQDHFNTLDQQYDRLKELEELRDSHTQNRSLNR